MNMNKKPTKRQLQALIKSCDDHAGRHILWVDTLGEVRITLLAKETPAEWAEENDNQIRFRYETYGAGNDYVGPEAAGDQKYIELLFKKLVNDWKDDRRGYLDI